MPIYVRPEREQAEHDRLIRHLQTTYSQQYEAVANPGDERNAPVRISTGTHFPDLVLNDGKRLAGLVEVETVASVNNLETMAKWVPFSKARVPFHLYVPVPGYEAALRLAEAHHVKAAEIWTYRPASDGFDLVRMYVDAGMAASRRVSPVSVSTAGSARAKSASAPKKPVPPPAKPARAARPAAPAKSAKRPAAVAAKAKSAKPARPAARKAAAKPAKPARAKAGKPAPRPAKKGAGARKKR